MVFGFALPLYGAGIFKIHLKNVKMHLCIRKEFTLAALKIVSYNFKNRAMKM